MAGNLVKWWRHKILGGGYKQFSVLQDSATDSEEIIYPIRAPSSCCSAPPDLLLTTGQDQTDCSTAGVGVVGGLRHGLAVVATGAATTTNCHNSPVTSCGGGTNGSTAGVTTEHYQVRRIRQKLMEQRAAAAAAARGTKENLKTPTSDGQQLVVTEELVRLEELHCDVSLEQRQNHSSQNHHQNHHSHHNQHHRHSQGDQPTICDHKGGHKAKTQPVQFSFTLYDLDGHGKITKDDIAGIVSTIYESLGKSVVVPHYGSKTINVRLTVSPDSSAANATATAAAAATTTAKALDKSKKMVTPRRRYRPRKLISDDENSDSSNDLNHKNCMSPHKGHKLRASSTSAAVKGSPMKSPLKEFSVMAPVATVAPILTTPTLTEAGERNLINLKTPTNSIYMNLDNGHAFYDTVKPLHCVTAPEIIVSPYHEPGEVSMMARHQHMLMQQKEQRKKLLRKARSRKQKYNEMGAPMSRARSLSVGNEQRWKRTASVGPTMGTTGVNSGVELFDQEDQLNGLENLSQVGGGGGGVGGVPHVAGGKSDEECWRSSLRRRELIEIIRESMEKNRLCFQTNNRKPLENGSPVMMKYNNQPQQQQQSQTQHRHRSHTINHGGVMSTPKEENGHSSGSGAVNLCGYDSYLHATICAGNGHHGGVLSPNMVGVATPIRKKCNQKLIKSRLRHQQLLAQQQQAAAQLAAAAAQHQHHHHHQSVMHGEKAAAAAGAAAAVTESKRQQRKAGRSLMRSKSKEELVTREKLNIVEGLLTTESFIDKLKITEDFAEQHVTSGEEKQQQQPQSRKNKPTELIMEYGSVPVTAEPGECESLLRCTSSATTPNDEVLTVIGMNGTNNQNELFIDESPKGGGEVKYVSQKVSPTHSSPKSVSAVHRYGTHVHTHIHHHYHHFENEENVV